MRKSKLTKCRSTVPGHVSELLNLLRDEAGNLLEADLPSGEELRSIVGAVIQRLERLETDLVGEVKPAPEKDPVVQPDVAHSVQPGPPPEPAAAPPTQGEVTPEPLTPEQELEQAQKALAAAQERVDAEKPEPAE